MSTKKKKDEKGGNGGGGNGALKNHATGSLLSSSSSSSNKVKVPKPVVLPSMKKEHNGYDPKVNLIKGSGGGADGRDHHSKKKKNAAANDNDEDDIVSKLKQNGGGWGQPATFGEQQTFSSSSGNDTVAAKIVEVKPIQSAAQWGTNAIVGGEKDRGGESVVRVHEHDPSALGKTNVVSRREEKVTRREFPSLKDSLDPNKNATYNNRTNNNIAEDADHHRKFEMSSDDRGRYEYENTTMQRSSRNVDSRSQHYRDNNNGRRRAEDASAFLKQNSSIGNVTIMKRTDGDATETNDDNNNNNKYKYNNNNNKTSDKNTDREESNSSKNNYVDEARLKFEDEIDRVARELEAKKLSSKASTWAGKSTPATATTTTTTTKVAMHTSNPLRMLVGNSKQQQLKQQQVVTSPAEIAAAPTTTKSTISPTTVRREHLTTQQLIELRLQQQQEQNKRFGETQHQQHPHAKQHHYQQGGELLKMRKKRGGRRVREAEERRLLKQTLGATTTTTSTQGMPPGATVKVLSKEPSSTVNSENILRQKPSSSLSTSHRLLRRQQQFEQQQKLTEKLEKDILEASMDKEEEGDIKRNDGNNDEEESGIHRSASGASLLGKIEPVRIASSVLSVDNAFGNVWSSSNNAMVNDNSESGGNLPAQNANDDPLFGLDLLNDATATTATAAVAGGWNSTTANVGSHAGWLGGQQHQQDLAYGQRPRSVPPTSTVLDVASALPDDLDDEFESSDSLYDTYNMNDGEGWDDYNNYLYAQQQQQQQQTEASAKPSRLNRVLDAPSFVPGGGYTNVAYGNHPHQSSSLSIEQQYQMYMQSVAQSGSQMFYDMNQYIDMQRDYEEQFGMSDMDFLYHAMQEQATLASATNADGMQQQKLQHHHQHHGHHQSQRGGKGPMHAQNGGGKHTKLTGRHVGLNPKKKNGGGHITSRERRRLQRLLTGISKVGDPNAVYPTTSAASPSKDDTFAAESKIDASQTLTGGTSPPSAMTTTTTSSSSKRGSRGVRGGRRGAKKTSSSPGDAE